MIVDLEGKLYLFSKGYGKKRNDLLITAHGVRAARSLFTKGFIVPEGKTLSFYGPDGEGIWGESTSTLKALLRGEVRVYEQIRVGAYSNDYHLAKFHHSKVSAHNFDFLDSIVRDPAVKMDILSIRNRWPTKFDIDIKLSEVLQILDRSQYKYQNIHCLFCRNSFWDILSTYGSDRAYDIEKGYFTSRRKSS